MLKPWKRNTVQPSTTIDQPSGSNASSKSIASFFNGLDNRSIETLTQHLKPQALVTDETLFRIGSPVDALYFVTKGRMICSDDQQAFVTGDWITDITFDSGDTHQLSLRASEPTALLSLSLHKYEQLPNDLQIYLQKGLLAQTKQRQSTLINCVRDSQAQNRKLKDALYLAKISQIGDFVHSSTAQQVLAKVPRIPVSSMQLLTKLLDPNSTQQEVVELIRQDPSLTSTLLKSINSASYGLENKISDIQHAISLLGIDSVYQIVVSESMRSSLPDTEFFRANHQSSLETSHLAFALSQLTHQGKPTEMATLGLMSQIGEVVVELLKNQSPKLASLFVQVDAPSMGSALLKSWSLPSVIYEPIAFKNHPFFAHPDALPTEVRQPVAILYSALICRKLLYKQPIDAESLYLSEYSQLLNINLSTDQFLTEKVIPALRRRKLGLPQSLRLLIE